MQPIPVRTPSFVESRIGCRALFYYRDKTGWLKARTHGRTFRATAEQVLNHVLPVLAGLKPNHQGGTSRPDLHKMNSGKESVVHAEFKRSFVIVGLRFYKRASPADFVAFTASCPSAVAQCLIRR